MLPTSPVVRYPSSSATETELPGESIGRFARAGDVLFLSGDLGAGKTCFVRGLARGLESADRVSSPSFVLVNQYRGRVTLYHVDLYRVEGPGPFEELGLWDYAEDGVLAIEWPERAGQGLPAATLAITFEHGAAPDERLLRFRAEGSRGTELLAAAGLG